MHYINYIGDSRRIGVGTRVMGALASEVVEMDRGIKLKGVGNLVVGIVRWLMRGEGSRVVVVVVNVGRYSIRLAVVQHYNCYY